jgi:hypothetical protein
MSANNLTILSSTQGLLNSTGDPVLGTSYAQSIGSQYTVAIYALNLTGRVYVEGTLATHPTENDWFPITLAGQSTPYVQFPWSGQYSTTTGGLQLVGFSFKGNLTWVRARLNRDYLNLGSPTEGDLAPYGYVDRVVLNIGGTVGVIDESPSGSGGIESVQGYNLGSGSHMYASMSGESNVILNFKSLVEGAGIQLTESSSTIMVSSTVDGAGTFVGLSDTPSSIVSNAVVVGSANAVTFTTAASTANTALFWTGSAFTWRAFPEQLDYVFSVKSAGSNVVADATAINFVGNAVSVTNVSGVPTVAINYQPPAINETHDIEYVMIQYTAGASGVLNASDAIVDQTDGVDTYISDTNNCIIQFTFTGRDYPPTAISIMGQVYSTNEFNYANVNPTLGTRKIAGGGTSSSPTLLGAFTGPITLQLRMSDTGASASVGQRAKAIVMFKF